MPGVLARSTFGPMLALRRTRVAPVTANHRWPAESDAYLTDGTRLFRVIAPLDLDAGLDRAVMEDCVTLEWRTYTFPELWWLRLQTVAREGLTSA
jgi:hypothetical protein